MRSTAWRARSRSRSTRRWRTSSSTSSVVRGPVPSPSASSCRASPGLVRPPGEVSVSEDPETVEDVYEPFLMQLGFLARTPRGRVATKLAYEHLGLVKASSGEQPRLF